MEGSTVERKRRFKDAAYAAVARFGLALAHPRRLELLDLLAQRARDLASLSREIGVDSSLVAEDLRVLAEAGVVERESTASDDRYRVAGELVIEAFVALRAAALERSSGRQVMEEHLGNRESLDTFETFRLTGRIERGEVVLLDVRPKEEYDAGHIPGARSAPLEAVDSLSDSLPKGVEVVAYCRGPFCTWADAAVARLRRKGIPARHMAHGVHEWRRMT